MGSRWYLIEAEALMSQVCGGSGQFLILVGVQRPGFTFSCGKDSINTPTWGVAKEM